VIDHHLAELQEHKHHLRLWGEVIAVKSTSYGCYVELLDKNEADLRALVVKLSAKTPVELGDYILVNGYLHFRVDERRANAALQISGARVLKNCGLSRRARARDTIITELQTTFSRQKRLVGPFSTIGVVTGQYSKALMDFERAMHLDEVTTRTFFTALDDPHEIAKQIDKAASDQDLDAIVVLRGGGNAVDFLPFEAEPVLRSAARVGARIPLLVALGHSTDDSYVSVFATKSLNTPADAGKYIRSVHWHAKKQNTWDKPLSKKAKRSPDTPAKNQTVCRDQVIHEVKLVYPWRWIIVIAIVAMMVGFFASWCMITR